MIYSQALGFIKLLGILDMKKLHLKHELRLRRASFFVEWISQFKLVFSSSKYTRIML